MTLPGLSNFLRAFGTVSGGIAGAGAGAVLAMLVADRLLSLLPDREQAP